MLPFRINIIFIYVALSMFAFSASGDNKRQRSDLLLKIPPLRVQNINSGSKIKSPEGSNYGKTSLGVRNFNYCNQKYVNCVHTSHKGVNVIAGKSQCHHWYDICLAQGYWPGY